MNTSELTVNAGCISIVGQVDDTSKSAVSHGDSEQMVYKDSGLSVTIVDQAVRGIFLCFQSGYRGFQAFHGCIHRGNRKVQLDIQTTTDYILDVFGTPAEQWNDGVVETLGFLMPEAALEFVWDVTKNKKEFVYLILDLKMEVRAPVSGLFSR